jgi:molybdenum cofactor cytidylyltransferase
VDAPTAIVLAAGASSRMGSCKALLSAGGRTLLARAVGAFVAVGVRDVVVVTGSHGDEVAAAAVRLGARPAPNPHHQAGMFTSVQAGAAAVPEGRRFFLLPVDLPLVRPETVGRLARAADVSEAAVVLPVHDGVPGHPPLLGPELRAEILAARPAGGLRELLLSRPERALRVPVDDPGVLQDADTPRDLAALDDRARREELPSELRCLELLRERGAGPGLIAHAAAVAAVAASLAAALNERRQYLLVPLVKAAALLHDVARAEPQHAAAGAALLEQLGYARLAPVVRSHMELGDAADGALDEAQVVYLADKLVRGDRYTGLEVRFAERLERDGRDPAAREAILARRDEACRVEASIEAVLGRPLREVAAGALPASARG